MAKRKGEISPRYAAKIFECHISTIYRWCAEAEDGRPRRLRAVRRDDTGHFWIGLENLADKKGYQ